MTAEENFGDLSALAHEAVFEADPAQREATREKISARLKGNVVAQRKMRALVEEIEPESSQIDARCGRYELFGHLASSFPDELASRQLVAGLAGLVVSTEDINVRIAAAHALCSIIEAKPTLGDPAFLLPLYALGQEGKAHWADPLAARVLFCQIASIVAQKKPALLNKEVIAGLRNLAYRGAKVERLLCFSALHDACATRTWLIDEPLAVFAHHIADNDPSVEYRCAAKNLLHLIERKEPEIAKAAAPPREDDGWYAQAGRRFAATFKVYMP